MLGSTGKVWNGSAQQLQPGSLEEPLGGFAANSPPKS